MENIKKIIKKIVKNVKIMKSLNETNSTHILYTNTIQKTQTKNGITKFHVTVSYNVVKVFCENNRSIIMYKHVFCVHTLFVCCAFCV